MSEAAEHLPEDDEPETADGGAFASMGADGNPSSGGKIDIEPEAEFDAPGDDFFEEPPAAAAPAPEQPEAAFPEDDAADEAIVVPRIGVHVFCINDLTLRVFEASAHDRRMAKAHVTVDSGSIADAAAHFQETPTPDLVIVESLARGDEVIEELDALAQVCDPSTKVIVVGAVNDIALYRELIRRGVSEYLVQPKTPLQVIRAIGGLYTDPTATPVGKVVSFIGAKGGVGASTLAHNVAWCVAEKDALRDDDRRFRPRLRHRRP